MKRLGLLIAFAFALGIGCAGQIPVPSDADALRASSTWPGTTRASLSHGRALYVERCSGCHKLFLPRAKPAEAWPALVHKMAPRSKVDPTMEGEIARYLSVAASAP